MWLNITHAHMFVADEAWMLGVLELKDRLVPFANESVWGPQRHAREPISVRRPRSNVSFGVGLCAANV
jgi:hypothetical protein